jgi:hypothetical protein
MVRDRKHCQFQPGRNTDLVKNVGKVPLHRVFAQIELRRNVPIILPVHDAANDLHLVSP